MKANDVLKVARSFLKDSESPYRWETHTLMSFMDIAQRSVSSMRPDALIDTDGTLITLSDVSGGTANTTLNLDDKWKDCMAHLVAAYAYSTDARDPGDASRATTHFETFAAMVRVA